VTLTEDNYQEQINSYTHGEWLPLLELIPEIEKTRKFGEFIDVKPDENGVYSLGWNEYQIISRFRKVVYNMPIMISYDWMAWDEGRKIASDQDFDFNTIEIPTKCKLITAIVRNDRFCDGALVSAFESGLILKILKSIERQVIRKP